MSFLQVVFGVGQFLFFLADFAFEDLEKMGKKLYQDSNLRNRRRDKKNLDLIEQFF